MPATSNSAAERLRAALLRVIDLREQMQTDKARTPRWHAVKRWQSRRLEQTYSDLLASPRYNAACRFFLEEIYGARDFAQRDREALRVVPKLARLLPERAVETMAHGVELDALSEALDARVAEHLRARIDAASYCAAYVAAGTLRSANSRSGRSDEIGRSLERLARVPLLSTMLHMMRGPAEAAGLGHLHRFLATGFDAFQSMGAAGTFLEAVRTRETALMQRVFDGEIPRGVDRPRRGRDGRVAAAISRRARAAGVCRAAGRAPPGAAGRDRRAPACPACQAPVRRG